MAEISLGIPVFDSGPFLDGVFACLRGLTPLPAEIVFLDDASSDDSLQRLREFAASPAPGPPVRVLHNERNAGIAGAYNRLVHETRSEWVQLLDADDLLVERDYFARVQPALIADNDLAVTGLTSNATLLAWAPRLLGALVPRHPPVWWPLLGSFATRAGVIYRRQRLIEQPFPDPAYPGSDVIHLLDLRSAGRCMFLPRPRVFYRVHGHAQSSRSRDYAAYRRQLARFDHAIRWTHGLDLGLRQIGQRWARG